MFELIGVGADPEVFLKTATGKPRSAEGLIGGTKDHPRPIPKYKTGFFVQEDNVAAEFNIPVAHTATEFSNYIGKALAYLEKVAATKKLQLDIVAAQHFDLKELLTPHAMLLGCDPDYCVWTEERNKTPQPPKTLRTAAGHVHISWEDINRFGQILVGKACDVFLGVPSVLATTKNERRELYGKAGAVRFKDYGLEYRTLDNFWIATDEHRRHVFSTVTLMMNHLRNYHVMFEEAVSEWGEDIQDCINNHDADAAIRLSSIFQVPAFPILP